MATKKSTAPTEAQSVRSEALPDRQTLERRIHEQRQALWRTRGVIGAARASAWEEADGDFSDTVNALDVAYALLEKIGSALDPTFVFAPAEAQEVANG